MESDHGTSPVGARVAGLAEGTQLLLGIDTCGPTGSVALARSNGDLIEIVGEMELEGRSYSATLVAAVGDLLGRGGAVLSEVDAIVAVNGPGSFTGVRVGLSAVKGLAEVGQIPVTAVSRLEVLAWKAGVGSAALDAHRHEVFLRLGRDGSAARELLAGVSELDAMDPAGAQIAVCDDAADALLAGAWPGVELVRVIAPTAADAIKLCAGRVRAREFVDLALLDGHYLRRSDAEIFGGSCEGAGSMNAPARAVRIRRMSETDLERVLEIAASLREAPHWAAAAYAAAMNAMNTPRRVALVAEWDPGEDLESCESAEKQTAGAKAPVASAGLYVGVKTPTYRSRPTARTSLSAACEAQARFAGSDAGTEVPAYRPSRFGVVGFAVAAVVAGEAELETIAVVANGQRRGVGGLLLRALVDDLKTAQASELNLEVRASNQVALGFYRQQGFEEAGRRPRYYADPEEDAVLMKLWLV